jgi:hypothetical protein
MPRHFLILVEAALFYALFYAIKGDVVAEGGLANCAIWALRIALAIAIVLTGLAFLGL